MSYDIPQIHIPDDSLEAKVIEAIISREHVTPEEVVLRALRGMVIEQPKLRTAATSKRKPAKVAPLTEEEIRQIDTMFPALEALDNVTDEQWSRIDKSIRRMRHAGLSARA